MTSPTEPTTCCRGSTREIDKLHPYGWLFTHFFRKQKDLLAMWMGILTQLGETLHLSRFKATLCNPLPVGHPLVHEATTIRLIAANLFQHAAKPPDENSRQKARGSLGADDTGGLGGL